MSEKLEEPAAKKARNGEAAGDLSSKRSLTDLKTLENFVFKEVLGSLPEKKVIC